MCVCLCVCLYFCAFVCVFCNFVCLCGVCVCVCLCFSFLFCFFFIYFALFVLLCLFCYFFFCFSSPLAVPIAHVGVSSTCVFIHARVSRGVIVLFVLIVLFVSIQKNICDILLLLRLLRPDHPRKQSQWNHRTQMGPPQKRSGARRDKLSKGLRHLTYQPSPKVDRLIRPSFMFFVKKCGERRPHEWDCHPPPLFDKEHLLILEGYMLCIV